MKYLSILLVIGATVNVLHAAPTDNSLKQTTKMSEKIQKALTGELTSKLGSIEQEYNKAQKVANNQEREKILAQVLLRKERIREAERHAREQFENLFSSGPIYIDARDSKGNSFHPKPWLNFIKKMVSSSSG